MTRTVRVAYPVRTARVDRRYRPWIRRAPTAAFLSFLFPGLGQYYNRQQDLAAVLGLPIVALLVVVALAILAGRDLVLPALFDTRFLFALLGLNLVLLGWRVYSIVQAHRRRARFSVRRRGTYLTAFLVLITLVMHAVPAAYGVKALDTVQAVALGGEGGGRQVRGVIGELPLAAPSEQPDLDLGERVNILLVGIDEAPGRDDVLTDTMLVVSIDPDGESAMLSVPRDLYGAPLPDGRSYDAKLNSLMTAAAADPESYPLGGAGTLKATISGLLGVPIHYFAAINLFGFKDAVDAIGGVDIEVERAISDPEYWDEYGNQVGFFIEPGWHHMDGHTALAFVRSRFGVGDDDFTRADRQQQLLTAITRKLSAGNLLAVLPRLMDAARDTVATDVPERRLPALARAVQDTDLGSVARAVIQPPDYVTPAFAADGAYILVPDLAAIRKLGQSLLRG